MKRPWEIWFVGFVLAIFMLTAISAESWIWAGVTSMTLAINFRKTRVEK